MVQQRARLADRNRGVQDRYGQIGSRKYDGRGTGRKRVAAIHDVSASPRSRSGYGSTGIDELSSERLSQADVKWRQVALADRLQFDLFRHYYRRMRPDFATFFINSTAHLQHAYWRHMEPDAFPLKPAKDEIESYGDAVLFGYRSVDALLRRFFALAEADTTIIPCSALSQQPFLKREGRGGQHFYRLRDISHFLQLLDIAPPNGRADNDPPISSPVCRWFRGQENACRPRALSLGEETVFGAHRTGTDIHFRCQIYDRLEGNGEIGGVPARNEALYFFEVLYAVDAVKSGRHHPERVLWVHTGEHAIHSGPASILDIAPTIYDLMGVRNGIAEATARGVSLVPRFRSSGQAEEKRVA
jgi:hypothetical protein